MKPGEYVAHLETKGKSREEPGKRLDAPTLLVEMEQNTDIAKYLRASCKKYLRKLLRQLELRYTPEEGGEAEGRHNSCKGGSAAPRG